MKNESLAPLADYGVTMKEAMEAMEALEGAVKLREKVGAIIARHQHEQILGHLAPGFDGERARARRIEELLPA